MAINVTPQPELLRDTYPLPLFGVWSNYNNNPVLHVYDSDFAPVSISTSPSYGYTAHEMYSAYTTQNYTNALVSSNSANYTIAGCFNNSFAGHQFVNGGASGAFSHQNVDNVSASILDAGNLFHETSGYRPDWYIAMNNLTLQLRTRNTHIPLDSLVITSANATGPTGTSRGMVCYNDRTRQLVAITALDAANNYRMHVWTAPNNRITGKAGDLKTFVETAKNGDNGADYKYRDFSHATTGSGNYNESRYRMSVIADDNQNVGMVRFTPSTALVYAVMIRSGAGWNSPVVYETLAATTSYGYEQGNRYGVRSNVTWDNNWVASYSPYYYYGSGVNVFFVDSRNAEDYYRYSSTSTSIGHQFAPVKESGFVIGISNNADGTVGMRHTFVDLQAIKNSGLQGAGTAISNGEAITVTDQLYSIDTGYTSTNYPCIITMASWRTWK
jgi:hypothetical protein